MTPEQIQELIDTLLGMGETMATEAFRVAMQQVRIEVAISIAWLVIALLVVPICVWIVYRSKKVYDEYEDITPLDVAGFLAAAIGILLSLNFFFDINTTILRALNPEWYAIKMVLNLLP